MKILIVGASKGLGKAFVEGLPDDDDTVIGISRTRPDSLSMQSGAQVEWIEADMAQAAEASDFIAGRVPDDLDVIIYNLGVWEQAAFTSDYRLFESSDEEISHLIQVNLTSAIILFKRLVPKLLGSSRPQVVLTGSTSALPQSGQPEVAYGASKFGLRGLADALRESFRTQNLAVTCLQLGDLNTDDALSEPLAKACANGGGRLIPVHDVVAITKTLLNLSSSSFVKEVVMPAIGDKTF